MSAASVIRNQKSEIERLWAAVQRYGLHAWSCPMNDVPSGTECTCGFVEFANQVAPVEKHGER